MRAKCCYHLCKNVAVWVPVTDSLEDVSLKCKLCGRPMFCENAPNEPSGATHVHPIANTAPDYIVYYPVGHTPYYGARLRNDEIAEIILKRAEASVNSAKVLIESLNDLGQYIHEKPWRIVSTKVYPEYPKADFSSKLPDETPHAPRQ